MLERRTESKRPSGLLRRGALISILTCLALGVGTSTALSFRGHAFSKTFGSSGAGAGEFDEPAGVALSEASGEVYVVDKANNRVEVFSPAGEFKGQFNGSGSYEVNGEAKSGPAAPAGALDEPSAIAVDSTCARVKPTEKASCESSDPSNGDVYVQDGFHNVVDKFNAEGNFLAQITVPQEGPFLNVWSVAVDAKGDLWVGDEQAAPHVGFDEFDSKDPNAFVKFVQGKGKALQLKDSLALDAAGNLYSAIRQFAPLEETIAKFTPTGTALNENLIEETSTGVASELPTNNLYIDAVSSVVRLTEEEPPIEVERLGQEGGQQHLVSGSGIAVNAASGQIFVADQSADRIAVFSLEAPRAPTVERESLAGVTASSATFQAEVNPRGASSEYRFEYGRCASEASCAESAYEESTPIPDAPLGEDFELHEVSAHPQDLSAASAYHFRVVAHNSLGESAGEEKTFTTQPAGVFGLPDNRGWEMVSPPQKNVTLIQAIGLGTPIEAALSGDAITYVSDSPTEAEPQGYSNVAQVLSARTSGGWVSKDITLPHAQATTASVGLGAEYRLSSADLSKAVLQPFGAFDPALSPLASEQSPVLRENYEGGQPSHFCEAASGCLAPLVSAANTREGAQFGEEGQCPPRVLCGPVFLGASPDLSHIVLSSATGLSEAPEDNGGLYEWSGGTLQLVSVLASGKPGKEASLGRQDFVTRQAISPDGERVVWSEGSAHLYLRELGEEATIELNEGLSGEPQFQAADAQTMRIFFSDEGALYEFDVQTGQRTTLLGPGSGVQGIIPGVSEDGRYVYVVANAQLGEGAVKGGCSGEVSSTAASCNLYELHEEEGGGWQAHLVAVLSGGDFPDFTGELPELTARVSPDGNYLAFMSQRPLSGYDNRDAKSAKRDEEVYLYDAGGEKLSCASCRPTGARPEGIEYEKLKGGVVAGPNVWPGSTWLAGNIPGWTSYRTGNALHQSRYLDDSGRLFFNSADALSPQDVNGTEDVYEYEPPGVGNCSQSLPSYSPRSAGCVGLISSGTSREESGFLDASETGADVFFLTSSKLVSADFDTALDVYDAHECTAALPCIQSAAPPSPPCASEASCKAPPSLQPEIFGAPASATFSGAGNIIAPPPAKPAAPSKAQLLAKALASCRAKYKGKAKQAKKRRVGCEAQAQKKYGAKKPAAKKGAKKATKKKGSKG
jgi:DNA-binding beta-propeller fold protein YncE